MRVLNYVACARISSARNMRVWRRLRVYLEKSNLLLESSIFNGSPCEFILDPIYFMDLYVPGVKLTSMLNPSEIPPYKRMRSDRSTCYASGTAADAGRYE